MHLVIDIKAKETELQAALMGDETQVDCLDAHHRNAKSWMRMTAE